MHDASCCTTAMRRHREWREAVRKSTTEHYPQYPIDGPLSCLSLCTHFERHGGSPSIWLAQWLRDKRLESTDRVAHELRVLVETLQTAGSYDQLNLGRLAAIEIVARLVQIITEAHANTQKPNWDTSKFFSGTSAAGDAESPQLRQYVVKKAKDAVDVENLSHRGRGMKETEHSVENTEGPTPGDDKAKGRGRRRGWVQP